VSGEATKELFAAIGAHSSHCKYLDAEQDAAATARVKAALAAGADWRALLGPGHRDAAFAAASQGSSGPLEALLDHGIPPHHANGGDGMIIHRAAAFSNLDAIRLLVARGVAPDVRDEYGRTPLSHARQWKHGAYAVPVIIELMQAHGCTPKPASKRDDFHAAAARTALSMDAPAALARSIDAFFTECLSGKAVDFLQIMAEQDDGDVLAAAIDLARKASTAKPRAKSIAGTKNGKPKRINVIHHGDLEIGGDVDAVSLVVTGDLTVAGLLTNYEGCVIAAGGSITAGAIWSGPVRRRGRRSRA
jgi:hypothetical protein